MTVAKNHHNHETLSRVIRNRDVIYPKVEAMLQFNRKRTIKSIKEQLEGDFCATVGRNLVSEVRKCVLQRGIEWERKQFRQLPEACRRIKEADPEASVILDMTNGVFKR